MMNIAVLKDYEALSKETARLIMDYVRKKPDALLCLAGGNTPLGTYKELVEAVRRGEISFAQSSFVGLDEWVGLGREDEGSCRQMLYDHFFVPAGIREEQIFFFDGKAEDLEAECRKADEYIFSKGKIGLILLGLGLNGHLGFNEPGVSPDLYSHVVELDETTRRVGQKYFKEEKQLTKGITLGLRHILDAETVLVKVNGRNKAEIVKRVIEGEVSTDVPATILKRHPNCTFLLDEEAACLLEKK